VKLGLRSRLELRGVHPRLVAVVQDAISITDQDFRVMDGLRDIEEQKELVARGASQTLRSKHLAQPDGYGHAVDLVPVVNGVPRWEWPLIYPVARAMLIAATRNNVPLTWGGVWDRPFLSLAPAALELEVENYVARRKALGLRAFIDGPHYQIGEP
jgi:peptidoglycan L-alanyl-D-glutamate endopeptidase CwlK